MDEWIKKNEGEDGQIVGVGFSMVLLASPQPTCRAVVGVVVRCTHHQAIMLSGFSAVFTRKSVQATTTSSSNTIPLICVAEIFQWIDPSSLDKAGSNTCLASHAMS